MERGSCEDICAAPTTLQGNGVDKTRLIRLTIVMSIECMVLFNRIFQNSGSLQSIYRVQPTVFCIFVYRHFPPNMVGWLVVLGLRQDFSPYRAVSQREGERGEKR